MLVFVIKLTQMGRTVYDKTYLYPAWADAFGVCLASSSMIAIPTVFILEYLRKAFSKLFGSKKCELKNAQKRSNGGSFIAAYNREVSFLENIQDLEFYSKLSTAASNKWKDVITERISAETKAIISGLEKEEKNISSKDDFLIES